MFLLSLFSYVPSAERPRQVNRCVLKGHSWLSELNECLFLCPLDVSMEWTAHAFSLQSAQDMLRAQLIFVVVCRDHTSVHVQVDFSRNRSLLACADQSAALPTSPSNTLRTRLAC